MYIGLLKKSTPLLSGCSLDSAQVTSCTALSFVVDSVREKLVVRDKLRNSSLVYIT
jgi:hypothetical protein